MAKQQRALVTRQRVLSAAGEIFAERGYHRASIGQILDRSGVTKGALYFAFASKEDMATAVLAHLPHEDAITIPESPVRLQTVIRFVNHLADPPPTDPVLRGALRLADELEFEGDGWHERIHLTITALLTDASHAGELLLHVDAADSAELITTFLAGLRHFTSPTTGEDGPTERITRMWRYLLPVIAIPALDLGKKPTQSHPPTNRGGDAEDSDAPTAHGQIAS